MKPFVFLILMTSVLKIIDGVPIAEPEAKPEPCLEIIFRILQLILTTTSRPRRREYTTTEDSGEYTTSTAMVPVDSSGESPDGPSVDENPTSQTESTNTEASSTDGSEFEDSDMTNDVPTNDKPVILKQRKANSKQKIWWLNEW